MESDGVELTNFRAKGVLSPPGRCSSRARTTQLAMMVNSTAYSNGVHVKRLRKNEAITSNASFKLYLAFVHQNLDFSILSWYSLTFSPSPYYSTS